MWLFGKKKDKAKAEPAIDIGATQKNLDDQVRMTDLNIKKYEKQCEQII